VLTCTITVGTRTVLGEVKFKGLAATREAAIRKQLSTQLGQPVLDDVTQRDVLVVQTALYEEGLLTSRIDHALVDSGEAKVDLVFTIDEGPVFKLGTVKVKGPRAKDAKAYTKAIAPLKKGAVAKRSILVAAVKAIEAVHAGDQPVPIVIPQSNVQKDKKLVEFDFVVE
jgi:outer membrane protein assembly factor BamA